MNNLRGDFLSCASVVLLGGTIWALFYVDFPDGGKDVLLVVIGVLTTVVKDVYSFEFSTSKSGERSAQVVADTMKAGAAKADAAPIKTDDVKIDATNASISIDQPGKETK